MMAEGWKVYNRAAIPTVPPHEKPDVTFVETGAVWKEPGVWLARWTTDFDCGRETEFWYVLKDTPFDLAALKAKRRYEINKGCKNFDVRIIDPTEYKEELYGIRVAAFSAYPKKYRPTVDKNKLFEEIDGWNNDAVFGAFSKETGALSGYATLSRTNVSCVSFDVLKTVPESEPLAINAALVFAILEYYCSFLENGGYICDGARVTNHETHFQDYLEKYFGFRKAYCRLHLAYHPKIRWIVRMLYPMRGALRKLDCIGMVHRINAILKMEEWSRKDAVK